MHLVVPYLFQLAAYLKPLQRHNLCQPEEFSEEHFLHGYHSSPFDSPVVQLLCRYVSLIGCGCGQTLHKSQFQFGPNKASSLSKVTYRLSHLTYLVITSNEFINLLNLGVL